jgi:hypothetical protein
LPLFYASFGIAAVRFAGQEVLSVAMLKRFAGLIGERGAG